MEVFSSKTSRERKLDCIQRMLFNHVIDFNKKDIEFDKTFLQLFYRLLGLRDNLLAKILNEIEHYKKVVVRFDCKNEGDSHSIDFGVFHADECRWEDLFEGLDSNQSGLCLSFCFNGDKDNSAWYFATEGELKKGVLAKVFDIKL